MTARRQNGWQRSLRDKTKYSDPPVVPTAWETLLHNLGVSEENAARSHKGREWVKAHWNNRYVPEPVLDAVGIPKEQR